ncbi:HAD-IA family hydrolase [Glaciihabitans sp. dw_435]|uniref:HAD-IA family hydrolase n=1 Tax=Glaciihabitans sp. dw_435 TaxID=2720081 RepID=UPI001BD40BD1|nr:HAD-IA family hydrolase [Glaciihabitans sp. dw_435]
MTDSTIDVAAILFDMDGTLVDSTPVVESVWARFADRFGLDLAEILSVSHGRQMEDTVLRFGPRGVDVAEVSRDLSEFEFASKAEVLEIAGAAAFIATLPAASIALVTSAPRRLAGLRMNAIGVPMPAVLVAAEDADNGKPHPEPYVKAATALGVDPGDIVVFEDAEAGIASALAAGTRVVVVGDVASPNTVGLPRIPNYTAVRTELRDVPGQRPRIILTL